MMLSSYNNTYTVFSVFYKYAILTIPILSGFVVVVVNSFIINNSAADHYGGGAATIITSYYSNHCNKYSSSSTLMSSSLMSSMSERTTCYMNKSLLQRSKDQKQKQTTFTLRCSSDNIDEYQQHNNNENSNENENNEYNKYYRSISDVVGGLHGGKYQFDNNYNNDGVGDNAVAFSGTGSSLLLDDEDYYSFNQDEEAEEEDKNVPNWVTNNMEPNFSNYQELIVPTNSNPMDGMIYFSSITIKNDERTWEKFYTKIITINDINSTTTTTTTTKIYNNVVTVQPKSGFLAPRGGTSNVCDINKPYSDKATIRIIQQNNNKNNSHNQKQHGVVTTADNIQNNNNKLWLVVGTEEEKWSYKLILEVFKAELNRLIDVILKAVVMSRLIQVLDL
ncbi:hypothetical protein FRACYDRAFT_240982 [Fragilariopsis cylindrus CCMP1102]|uniref:Uncharacterized protein n=1 Tax=Fragilariopsis cylindrus CCMP1102 TaxID=635003 RepID=A0A1E7F8D6_9STRA|nr:hypothetical protein FRACYDRAFT_240982 [Fragilariopsis cylindrus CCMP1102]|eukprot:OEU14440.1 hypothetical protein FRACYDRAFT_240982 [Fragilariopsis cylindrus CCMP1102]